MLCNDARLFVRSPSIRAALRATRRASTDTHHRVPQVEAALRDGYDVRGMLYWSLTDNFEWQEGFNMKVDSWSGFGKGWRMVTCLNVQPVDDFSRRGRWPELIKL